ncbi:MAG: tetratricopeptide repeat protein [Pseudomonadales bacterium]|nr:tetratricopeptide repeat protein [Pseudomonadales bacterium]
MKQRAGLNKYNSTPDQSLTAGWFCSVMRLLLVCVLFSPTLSIAASYTLSDKIYKSLTKAQTYNDKKQPDQAIQLLEKLLKSKALKRYEIAMINNQLGYLYYQENRSKASINAFKVVTKIEEVPEALKQSSLYTLAQIYFEQENYNEAIQVLKRWFSIVKNPSEDAYAFLAQAYYQTNNHQLVVDNMNKAINIIEQKNLSPIEQWLVMLQSSYSELGLIENRIGVMKWLIRIYPEKDYFLALSTAYGILDKRNKQLSVLEIAYKKGYLEQSSELLTLASLMFSQGAPYKAAKVLKKGIDEDKIKPTLRNFKFLASAWIAAQEFEKSIPVLKKAAVLSATGEIDVMVGNSYYNTGQWQQAANAFQKALEKGDINHAEKIWLLVGQCYLNLKEFETAQKIFAEAVKFKEVSEKAEKWLRYTTLEEQRYQAYLEFQKQQ